MSICRRTLTPGTVIALLALFFALGGSAFAVGERVQGASAPQQRCSNGAVRGIAYVTGNPTMGIANIGGTFTSAGVVFGRKFNCNGKAVQVRRVSLGVFEIRFVGNPASSALASGVGDAYAVVDPLPVAFSVSPSILPAATTPQTSPSSSSSYEFLTDERQRPRSGRL